MKTYTDLLIHKLELATTETEQIELLSKLHNNNRLLTEQNKIALNSWISYNPKVAAIFIIK